MSHRGWTSSPFVYSNEAVSFAEGCNTASQVVEWWGNQSSGAYGVDPPLQDIEGGSIFAWGLKALDNNATQSCAPGGFANSQTVAEVSALGAITGKGTVLQEQSVKRVNRRTTANGEADFTMTYLTIALTRFSVACEVRMPITKERGSPDDFFIIWYDMDLDFSEVTGTCTVEGACNGKGAWFDKNDEHILSFVSGVPQEGNIDKVYASKQPLSLVFVNPLYETKLSVPQSFMSVMRPLLSALERAP
jgi:hypothetical protein